MKTKLMNHKSIRSFSEKELEPPRRARWIWYDLSEWDLVNTYMLARKTFELSRAPKRAIIHITADLRYRLWVNGTYVTRGPARGIAKFQPFDTIDIGPFLCQGRNVIAARVYQAGVGTFQSVHMGVTGLLVESVSPRLPVDTDVDWRVMRDVSIRRNVVRTSLQLSHQEHFDASKEEIGWRQADFDDSHWLAPHARGHGAFPPFTGFEPRGIPQMREELVAPESIVAVFDGRSKPGCRDTANVTRTYLNDGPLTKAALVNPPTFSSEGMSLGLEPTGADGARAVVVDFGRTVTGSAIVEMEGSGGEILDLLYTEGVDGDGRPIILDPDEGCRVSMADRILLRSGSQSFEVFDYRGFRYITLVLRNALRPVLLKRLALRRVEYPVELRGKFESSNNLLNRVFAVGVWTQRNCMFDAFVDCPWREQAQWWGDARIQARVAQAAFADTALVARGIRQAAQTQLESGLTFGHFPTTAYHCILPDFTLTWIMSVEDHYLATDSAELARKFWPNIEKALQWFERRLEGPGLLGPEPDYWLFLDWAPLYKQGFSAVYNMLYLEALRGAARLARLVRRPDRVKKYEADARKLEKTVTDCFFDPRAGLWRDGATLKGKRIETISLHANALAVLLDLKGSRDKTLFEKGILPALENRPEIIDGSPFFYVRAIQALKKLGLHELAVKIIRDRWGQMIETGATTFYEGWNAAPGSGSLCHAWSSSPVFFLQEIILGVERLSPGWKKVRIAPHPCGLEYAKGTVPTPWGDIEVQWNLRGRTMELAVRIPKGVTAQVEIGGQKRLASTGKYTQKGEV